MQKHMNVALKTAMFASGKKQQRIARLARVSEQKLSHAIYGRRLLDDGERQRLARVLGLPVSALFPVEAAIGNNVGGAEG